MEYSLEVFQSKKKKPFRHHELLEQMAAHVNARLHSMSLDPIVYSTFPVLECCPSPKYARNGFLSNSQGATLGDCLYHIVEKGEKRRIYIPAPCQWGKSTLQMALMFFLPVAWYVQHRKAAISIMSLPAANSLYNQSEVHFKNFWRVNKSFIVRGKEGSISLDDYWKNIFGGQTPLDLVEKQLFKRTRGKRCIEFEGRVQNAIRNDLHVFYFEDELHFGQDQGGVADRLDQLIPPSFHRIGSSATPSEQIARKDLFFAIPAWLEKGYVGPSFTHEIDYPTLPGYREVSPSVFTTDEFFPDLNLLDGWNKSEFRPGFLIDLCLALNRCWEQTKGVIVRTTNNNTTCKQISDFLRPRVPGQVINYFGDSPQTMVDLCKNIHEDYVILVTGKARMGDTLPAECKIGLDLTKKPSTIDTVFQNLYGRMCGYHGERTVILSPDCADHLKHWLDSRLDSRVISGGEFKKNPSIRTIYARTNAGRRYSFFDFKFFPELHSLQRKLVEIGPRKKQNDENWYEKIRSVFSPKIFTLLESFIEGSIVRWGEQDEDGNDLVSWVEVRHCSSFDAFRHDSNSRGGAHQCKHVLVISRNPYRVLGLAIRTIFPDSGKSNLGLKLRSRHNYITHSEL